MEHKTTLEIIIDNVEFAQDFNYFLTLQLDGDGEKRRTDVSEKTKKPVFKSNKFYLPLKDYDVMINQKIVFAAFVVVDAPENKTQKGKDKLKFLERTYLN